MKQERSKIIETVNTPLGFFALSLLIIEGFLGIVLIFAKTPQGSNLSFYGMWIGAGLFVIVVCAVTLLAWYKADELGLSGKDRADIRKKEMENRGVFIESFPKKDLEKQTDTSEIDNSLLK